jgi:hypothetical protein
MTVAARIPVQANRATAEQRTMSPRLRLLL